MERLTQAELEQQGIGRVPSEVHLWRGYRNSSERCALAAEKRSSRP